MLTVRSFTNTRKSVAFYNTLETFSFSGTNNINSFTFGKNVYSNGFTNIFFYGIVPEFFYELFSSSLCFSVVILFRQ